MTGSSNPSARLAQLCALLLLSLVGAAGLASPASAASDPPFPIKESFSNTLAPGWTFGGSAALTAPGTDTAGNGWLRLTSTTATQFGYGFYDTAFPSTKGAQVEFDYATYGGTGADGLTFFLYDGATTSNQFVAGPAGGSLGYACSGSTPGLKNAYIGVGFDEYGNFGNPSVCGSGANTLAPNNVVVRGSEANGYPILTKTATSQALTSGDRLGARHVTISIAPDKKLNVYIKYPNGQIQTAVSNYQLPTTGVPPTFKLGYAGSTGGSTNFTRSATRMSRSRRTSRRPSRTAPPAAAAPPRRRGPRSSRTPAPTTRTPAPSRPRPPSRSPGSPGPAPRRRAPRAARPPPAPASRTSPPARWR